MDNTDLFKWLTSKPDDEWNSFDAYGDVGHAHFSRGNVWWNLRMHTEWFASTYDTRRMALNGDGRAITIMTDYHAALIAAQLKDHNA